MLSRRALSDVWSGGAAAGGAGAARTERFLHVGQALKLDAVLRGDAPTSLVSTGKGTGLLGYIPTYTTPISLISIKTFTVFQ